MSDENSADITIAGLLYRLTPKQAWTLASAVVLVMGSIFTAGLKLEQYREAHRSVEFATVETRAEFLSRYARFLISREMDRDRVQGCMGEISAETYRSSQILAELISIWWDNQGHSTANPTYNPGSVVVEKGYDPVGDAHVVFPTGESWPCKSDGSPKDTTIKLIESISLKWAVEQICLQTVPGSGHGGGRLLNCKA